MANDRSNRHVFGGSSAGGHNGVTNTRGPQSSKSQKKEYQKHPGLQTTGKLPKGGRVKKAELAAQKVHSE